MRVRKTAGGVTVHAIAGTYVVMLGMDAEAAARAGLLGFAIERIDKTENEQYWLTGMRTFKSVYPNPPRGSLVSTHHHPIQDFLWSDFTAKPAHDYVYRVVPVRGKPKKLEYGPPVEVNVQTEVPGHATHSVYFNRGVIGSQAYAREFDNKDPRDLKGAEQKRAYDWLSRGLFEGMRDFLRRATGPAYGLRAAVYEFSYDPIVAEFGAAQKRCKDVQIVYDARVKTSKGKPDPNEAKRVALTEARLKAHGLKTAAGAKARTATPSAIAHNKFVVLLKDGDAVAVWTGSTNFTESGIFGQSNVGHVVEDPTVAAAYLAYWKRLHGDPDVPALRGSNNAVNPDLAQGAPPPGISPIFSPRLHDAQGRTMLNWYAGAMDGAKRIMCFTAAFGVNQVFLAVLKTPAEAKDDLRYLFLEKWGVNAKLAAATKADLEKNRHNQVAVGGYLAGDVLHEYLKDRWAIERANPLSHNVRYTHTKYLLVDPLGDDPIVVSGSANFSEASTVTNDENMLVVRGDTRVADIYLGEFMRLWRHYNYRTIVNAKADPVTGAEHGYEPNYLAETSAWTDGFYRKGTLKEQRRLTFR
jgi:phosphatidylserine/phosphatidylglycerophosphate/cardiolipin synthase-like enzyme